MSARDDERMHEALREIGPGLPEPTAPGRVREAIEGMACRAETPVVRAGWWRRAGVGVLGAVAATLAIATGVMAVQNARLSAQLEQARSALAGGGALVRPAAGDLPPLVAMSFYHEMCPVAGEVAPRFEALKASHCERAVLFVTFDVGSRSAAQSARLAEALGCDFVYECEEGPEITSGTVVLADMRSKSVIKSCRGAEGLDEIERALDDALQTCEPGG